MTIQQTSATRCIFRTVLTDLVGLGGNLHRSKSMAVFFTSFIFCYKIVYNYAKN